MTHHDYLNRCYQLALLAGKDVGSNPNVGAVIVYKDEIIGEGFHKAYGGPHAEVNAVASVSPENLPKLKDARIYVSLEPCCHHGKTPPCTQLILDHNIPEVHIGTIDPFSLVAGKGISILQKRGVNVTVHNDPIAKSIIKPFTTIIEEKRPFITLKFAKSKDNYMGKKDEQVWLSNALTKVHAHQLRSENDAILLGTNSVLLDNPSLTTREYPGQHPIRFIIDKKLKTPDSYHIYNSEAPTVIFNNVRDGQTENIKYYLIEGDDFMSDIMTYCIDNKINRLLVEGGAMLLKSLISADTWDQTYIYNTKKILSTGIKAPNIEGKLVEKIKMDDNYISKIVRN